MNCGSQSESPPRSVIVPPRQDGSTGTCIRSRPCNARPALAIRLLSGDASGSVTRARGPAAHHEPAWHFVISASVRKRQGGATEPRQRDGSPYTAGYIRSSRIRRRTGFAKTVKISGIGMADKLRRKSPTCRRRVTNAIASRTDAVEIGTREVQLAPGASRTRSIPHRPSTARDVVRFLVASATILAANGGPVSAQGRDSFEARLRPFLDEPCVSCSRT